VRSFCFMTCSRWPNQQRHECREIRDPIEHSSLACRRGFTGDSGGSRHASRLSIAEDASRRESHHCQSQEKERADQNHDVTAPMANPMPTHVAQIRKQSKTNLRSGVMCVPPRVMPITDVLNLAIRAAAGLAALAVNRTNLPRMRQR
jgi:hypothetical protein